MDYAMRIAALLCSRLCHDLIGAVAAIANGVELVHEDAGADTREQALGLIAFSAEELSRRIQFYRLAFGAPGGGADIEIKEARRVAVGLLAAGKVALDWPATEAAGQLLPSVAAKLVLNLI